MTTFPLASDIVGMLDDTFEVSPPEPQTNGMINMLQHYPFDRDIELPWSDTTLPDIFMTKPEPWSPKDSPVHAASLSTTSASVSPASLSPVSLSPVSLSPSSSPEYCTLLPVKQDPTQDAVKPLGLTMLQSIRDVGYSSDPLSYNAPSTVLQHPAEMEEEQLNLDIWDSQSPGSWSSKHVMSFVHFVAAGLHFEEDFHGERFRNKTGADLLKMTEKDFCDLDSKYGTPLYGMYKLLREKVPQHCFDDLMVDTSSPVVPMTVESCYSTGSRSPLSDECSSDENSRDGVVPSNTSKEEKGKKPKRRATSQRSGPHLWEFIRNLLLDEKYSRIISWEDREQGVFRIVHSEAVARLWGRQKNNGKMSYEKLSRALRFCRDAKYFEKLPANNRFPKKLCFKFGPRSDGWK